MDLKTKILELLNGMQADSKSESYKSERELCDLLTKFINKKEQFENALDKYLCDYPKHIYQVESECHYKELPEVIYCNEEDFRFYTDWLDIDWEEYFNTIRSGNISYLTGLIERVEATVVEHKKNLKKYSDITFDNIKHIIED